MEQNGPFGNRSPLVSELLTRSPCIGVCRLGVDGYCEGCRRSSDEIANWSEFAPEQIDRINRRLLAEPHHPAVRVRLLGEAPGGGQRRGGRRRRKA